MHRRDVRVPSALGSGCRRVRDLSLGRRKMSASAAKQDLSSTTEVNCDRNTKPEVDSTRGNDAPVVGASITNFRLVTGNTETVERCDFPNTRIKVHVRYFGSVCASEEHKHPNQRER